VVKVVSHQATLAWHALVMATGFRFDPFRRPALLAALVALIALAAANCPTAAAAGRVANEGAPDRAFAENGRLVTDIDLGSKDVANAVLPYGEGGVLVAGYSIKPPFGIRLAVALYAADGSLEPGFGGDGIVISDVEGGMSADAMAIDPVGQIVVAGPSPKGEPFGSPSVARLLWDGRLDPAFGGGDGTVSVPVQLAVSAIRTDGNGGIFLAGTHGLDDDSELAVFHLLHDGSPDRAFGDDGLVTVDLSPGAPDKVNDMMLDSLDRINLVGGAWFPKAGISRNVARFAIARLDPEGALDTSFGGRGFVFPPVRESGAFATAGALDIAGRAILAGRAGGGAAGFTAVREDGRLDRSYGKRGLAIHRVPEEYFPADLADDSHTRIVAALEIANLSTPRRGAMRCQRLRRDGSRDPRFGRGGRAQVRFGRRLATARAVAFASYGKILLAGYAKLPGESDTDFAVVRLRGAV